MPTEADTRIIFDRLLRQAGRYIENKAVVSTEEPAADGRADYLFKNPPFSMSDWGGENLRQDVSWIFGMPPVNNANYAWIEHSIHHHSPLGVAGFAMANSASDAPTNYSQ